MEPINLIFDLDDTLVNTNSEIYGRLEKFYIQTVQPAKLQTLMRLKKEGKTTLELPDDLKEDSWEFVVSEGSFMLTGKPTRLLAEGNIPWFEDLVNKTKEDGGKVGICTHRGFHKKALDYTISWLEKYGVREFFDDIHVIDGREIPNKLDYLKQHYDNVKLVDDNPLHNPHADPVEKDERLLIYTNTKPYRRYKHQQVIKSVFDIYPVLGYTPV